MQLNNAKISSQQGLSIVELMVGLLIGLVVLMGVGSVFLSALRGQTDNIQQARLNQEMRAVMDVMVKDIRRAGFVTSNPVLYSSSLQNNPFFQTGTPSTDVTIHNFGTGGISNCIAYSYNKNDNDPTTVESSDFSGFRYNPSRGEVNMRSGGGSTTANCTDGQWEGITDRAVEITALTFSFPSPIPQLNVTGMSTDTDADGCLDGDRLLATAINSACTATNEGNGDCDTGERCTVCNTGDRCLQVRTVTITLTAQLRNVSPVVSQTISHQVRIRNDKYIPSWP